VYFYNRSKYLILLAPQAGLEPATR